jgi:hypothetical protein
MARSTFGAKNRAEEIAVLEVISAACSAELDAETPTGQGQ